MFVQINSLSQKNGRDYKAQIFLKFQPVFIGFVQQNDKL